MNYVYELRGGEKIASRQEVAVELMELNITLGILDAGIFSRSDVELPDEVLASWEQRLSEIVEYSRRQREELHDFGSFYD